MSPKLRDNSERSLLSVGERSVGRRRRIVIYVGGIRNDYASMSSDNPGEKPGHRKSQVS